jgi:hypothetical protein
VLDCAAPGGWTATLLLAGLGEEIDQEKSQNTHGDYQHDQRKQTDVVFQKFSEHFHFLPPGISRRRLSAVTRLFLSTLVEQTPPLFKRQNVLSAVTSVDAGQIDVFFSVVDWPLFR